MVASNGAVGRADVTELLNITDVVARVRLSESTIREMVRNREFPAPLKFGRAARWSKAAVARWIDEQTGVTAERGGRAVQVRG